MSTRHRRLLRERRRSHLGSRAAVAQRFCTRSGRRAHCAVQRRPTGRRYGSAPRDHAADSLEEADHTRLQLLRLRGRTLCRLPARGWCGRRRGSHSLPRGHRRRSRKRARCFHRNAGVAQLRKTDRPRGAIKRLAVRTAGRATMELTINGRKREADVPSDMPVLWVLRDVLGMTGTKFGCGMALCGACTVQLEGQAIRSCVTPVSAVAGKAITTIEAIGDAPAGKKVQEAWIALDVPQCGYCQSGQVMSASALLASNAHPTDADIDAAMAGNICRCGTYERVRAAIKQAAQGAPIGGKGARP